jgi:hypothetical protein
MLVWIPPTEDMVLNMIALTTLLQNLKLENLLVSKVLETWNNKTSNQNFGT